MDNTEDFFKNYRGKYSQYWIERWGLIPELPTSFDNANSIYELVSWLQRAFKNLLDDFQQLESEFDDFKNALIDLLEYLIPELIRRYHDSAEFRAIFIILLEDILAGEERTWVKDLLKELLEVDMREWIEDYLKELNYLGMKEFYDGITAQLEDITLNARHRFGLVGDGSDETEKFQNALNSSVGKTLFLPKPQEYYYIGKITIPSNTTLVLDEGIEIVGKPLAQEGSGLLTERLINIIDVNDVVIKGNHSTIRLENKSQYKQEWNHIFNIQSSTNVYIYDISANDSGGDGFYVGDQGSINLTAPKNINLINCKANNNRRQGLSIITVDGFYAEKCEFNNTKGTSPQTGIDIEPNFPTQILKNIKFVDCSSTGNFSDGVRIHLKESNDSTEKISVEFINFKSQNNAFGYSLRDFTGVQGIINFVNCVSEINRFSGFVERGKEITSVKSIYSGCKSINDNVNGTSRTSWQYGNGSAFVFMAEKSGQTIGNSHVTNCFVIDNRQSKKINQGIALYSNPALTDIATDKLFIKYLSVDDDIPYLFEYMQSQHINISMTENESELRENAITSHGGNYRSVYPVDNNMILTNKGAIAGIRHQLRQPYDKLVYRFRVDEPQSVTIDTSSFGILGLSAGSHYKSTKQGSYLVLKGTNEGYYVVTAMIGEWNIINY